MISERDIIELPVAIDQAGGNILIEGSISHGGPDCQYGLHFKGSMLNSQRVYNMNTFPQLDSYSMYSTYEDYDDYSIYSMYIYSIHSIYSM